MIISVLWSNLSDCHADHEGSGTEAGAPNEKVIAVSWPKMSGSREREAGRSKSTLGGRRNRTWKLDFQKI